MNGGSFEALGSRATVAGDSIIRSGVARATPFEVGGVPRPSISGWLIGLCRGCSAARADGAIMFGYTLGGLFARGTRGQSGASYAFGEHRLEGRVDRGHALRGRRRVG